MTKHTMDVPIWIWDWARDHYGIENPAPRLREVLSETVADMVNQELPLKVPATSPSKKDEGTIFTARRSGICNICRKIFKGGTEIIVVDGKYMHLDCYGDVK